MEIMLLLFGLLCVSGISGTLTSEADPCVLCDCRTKYFPSPASFHYTDIVCRDLETKIQEKFDLTNIPKESNVRDIVVKNFHKFTLDTRHLIKNKPLLKRNILLENIHHLYIENWSSHCNYTFVNISKINFNINIDASDIEMDSLMFKSSKIDRIHSNNMNYKNVREKVVFTDVEIGRIETEAVMLNMTSNKSAFIMIGCEVGRIGLNGLSVKAEDIIISKSTFHDNTSYINLNGTNKVVITKSVIHQVQPRDFFNIYSPSIIIAKNQMTQPISIAGLP